MPENRARISHMLQRYENLIRRFAVGEMNADAFESDFLASFKSDPYQLPGAEFDVLDALFADVDDYVSDSIANPPSGGISGEELRTRARDAYVHLYGGLPPQ